jgi:hypothetical protein
VKALSAILKLIIAVAVLVAELAVGVIVAGFLAAVAFWLVKIGWYWV